MATLRVQDSAARLGQGIRSDRAGPPGIGFRPWYAWDGSVMAPKSCGGVHKTTRPLWAVGFLDFGANPCLPQSVDGHRDPPPCAVIDVTREWSVEVT